MMVFHTFAGELLGSIEVAWLCTAWVIEPANMSIDHVERAFAAAGFLIARRDVLRSEWREHEIEAGDTERILEDLLTVARLEGQRRGLVDRYGAARYELMRAGAIWRLLPDARQAAASRLPARGAGYRPLNAGCRFSPKAVMPSPASSDTKTLAIASRSSARPRSSGAPYPCDVTTFARPIASEGPAASFAQYSTAAARQAAASSYS